MAIQKDNNKTSSLLDTLLWFLFLVLGLPFISGLIIFLSGFFGLFLDDISTFEELDTNLGFNASISIVSIVLLLLSLKYALPPNNQKSIYSRLALKPLVFIKLIPILLVVFTYSVLECSLFYLGIIETPVFIIDFMAQIDSVMKVVLLFFVVGIIGPIFEEIVFRGFLFYKLKHVSLNPALIIVITSIFFTLIHNQYENIEVLCLIFISSCLLGGIRQLTGNLWYSILGHIVMNFTALIFDFLS
ncbi:type II CAAX endopeptidase family protein [Colwellia sp. 4_MG-2023]|uniref:CPBP family intramembrane glutamic endopeptidase n=1 Tax=unclassified Colwellia TaxID=196834 RepID=UPI0026E259D5|nr:MULTISPECIES: type II CAAX endopeptidase family protein [unclassified Colwellia]MDO6506066.1 type II CAAX endopeptidase family protein [Colwellia sp. 5_MG-2023]MDO6554874.1 type II CAAX endopeptidase family protein [Colwellia sp. 4_MG-2023]